MTTSTITTEARERVLKHLNEAYRDACVDQRRKGYSHAEAFCVMRYGDGNGPGERIWNSRDGVTPYGLEGDIKHIDWQSDRRAPDYAPQVGERVFVDAEPDYILASQEAQIVEWWEHEKYPMSKTFATQDEALEELTRHTYEGGIPPRVMVVTEEILRERGWHERKMSERQKAERGADLMRQAMRREPRRFA